MHRIEISDADVNSTIPMNIPVGQAKLTVELRNHAQEPSSAMLMLWSEDEHLAAFLAPEAGKEAKGMYVVNNLPVGPYNLRIGYARKSDIVAKIEVVAERENSIVVTLPETSTSPKGFVSLVVTDENGVFIPCQIRFKGDVGKMIESNHGPESISVTGLAGEYTLQINQPGFVPIEQKLVLTKSNATDLESKKVHINLRRFNSSRL